MALDYSKLSDDELQAIANDDYSKLSDKTLRQISRDPSAKQTTFEKFSAPLKEMSVEDWKKESIAYPVLQTMYGLLPFQGKQGEQAYVEGMQGIKQKGDTIVQGVKNIAQDPAAAAQAAWQAVTERPAETMGNLVKGAIYDPELLFVPVPGAKQAGQAVGQAAQAVAKPVIQGAKTVGKTVGEVGQGAVGRATGTIAKPGVQPEIWQTRSSRQPAGETYHPPADIEAWQRGEIPTAEVGSMPWTAEQQAALARTRGNVPFQGEVPRAIGEQLVEPYTTWQGWLPDVALGLGGTLIGAGPVIGPAINMARRGYNAVQGIRQAGAMQKLGDVGLTPLYKEELAALKSGQPHPSAIGDVAGPVVPAAEVNPAPTVTTQPVPATTIPATTAPAPTVTSQPTQYVPNVADTYANAKNTLAPQGFARADYEAVAASNLADDLIQHAKDNGIKLPRKDALAHAQREIEAHGNDLRNAEIQAQRQAFEASPEGIAQAEAMANAEAARIAQEQAAAQAAAERAAQSEMTKQDVRSQISGEFGKVAPTPLPDEAIIKDTTPAPKKKRTTQEERIAEREANMTPEELAAQEAEVAKNLKKSQGDNPLKRALGKESPSIKETEKTLANQYKTPAEMRKALYGTMSNEALEELVNKTFPSAKTLKEKMNTPKTESAAAADEALAKRLEAIKQASKNKRNPGTMEMMPGIPEFESRQSFLEQKMINDLAGKPTVGAYPEGNKKIVYETENVGPFQMVNVTEFDVKTGKQLGPTKRTSMKKIK